MGALLSDIGLIYAALVWGSTFVMVKQAIAGVHPLLLVGYRFLLAAGMLWLISIVVRRSNRRPKDLVPGAIVGFVLWLVYVPQTIGLAYTTAANSAFITGLFVVFVPLFGRIFFDTRPTPKDLLSVLLAVAGLYVLTGKLQAMNTGDLLTLITAAAYALHVLLTDRYVRDGVDPIALCIQQFVVTAVLSILLGYVLGAPLEVRSNEALGAIVFLAVFPTVSAFLIQAYAQRYTTAIKVALIFSLEPVFAAIFAWTWGGEPFQLHSAVGGLLIVGGMVVSALPARREL
ncbi:MAG: DMT family transporter [Bdellovibrionota bacterium]